MILPKDTKARLLAVSIAIVFFLFNIYAINAFLEIGKTHEASGMPIVDWFIVETEIYASYFFIIATISSILAISFGFFIDVESVSTGLILGGISLLIYSGARYWWFANNKARAIILGISLIVLIVIGFKMFGEKKKNKKN